MKVRSVANGNIIDLPEDHGLITAGIYEPVEEEAEPAEAVAAPEVEQPPEPPKSRPRKSTLRSPEKPLQTVANTAPAKKAAAPRKRSRKPK